MSGAMPRTVQIHYTGDVALTVCDSNGAQALSGMGQPRRGRGGGGGGGGRDNNAREEAVIATRVQEMQHLKKRVLEEAPAPGVFPFEGHIVMCCP